MRETRPGEGRDSPQFNVSSPVSRIGGAGKANRAALQRGVASPRGVILSHPFGGRHGEGGIRTLEAGISPPNALAGRRLQPLGHFSGRTDGNDYWPELRNATRSPT